MRILVNEFCGHPFQIELSREFARRGHKVLHTYFADNLTTPKGNLETGAGGPGTCAIEGLHIPFAFSKHSIRSRRRADIAYGRAVAAKVATFLPDVVISANMPLDAQKILQDAARQQNARFVFWLQDVYSSAIRFVLRKKFGSAAELASKLYERLEKRLLQESHAVVCISPGFSDVVDAWGIEDSRSFVIENWAPLGEVRPTARDNAWARENGLGDQARFIYSGTLGMKHRPELLLELAQHFERRADASLVVIAAGAGFDWLRQKAVAIDSRVLKLLPFQPYEKLSQVLGASDVLLALLDSEAGKFTVPSKTLSYLCAGRPLMLAAPRENHAASLVEAANAGVVVSPESTNEFLAAADRLLDQPAILSVYGANARAYAERCFAIEPIADRFLEVFARADMNPVTNRNSLSALRQMFARVPILSASKEA